MTPSAPSEPTSELAQRRARPPSPGRASVASSPSGVAQPHRRPGSVDPPVARRGLARRARRDAAADRRPLVALRDVAERQPVRGQRPVGLGQPHAGREHARSASARRRRAARPCRPRSSETTRREAARAAARRRRRRSSRRRTARPRRRRRAALRARRRTSSCVAGRDDRVRRVRAVARALGQQVEVGLAGGAQHARLAVVAHVLGADHADERARSRHRAPAARSRTSVERHRPRRRRRRRRPSSLAQERRRVRRAAPARRPARPSPRRPARASPAPPARGRRAPRRAPCRAARRSMQARRSARQPAPALAQLERHAACRRPPARAGPRRAARPGPARTACPSSSCAQRGSRAALLAVEPPVRAHGAAALASAAPSSSPSAVTALHALDPRPPARQRRTGRRRTVPDGLGGAATTRARARGDHSRRRSTSAWTS